MNPLEGYNKIDKAMLVAMTVISGTSAWAMWMVLNQKGDKKHER